MITSQKKHYGAESFVLENGLYFKLEFSSNKPIGELSHEEIIQNMDLLFDELDKLFTEKQ